MAPSLSHRLAEKLHGSFGIAGFHAVMIGGRKLRIVICRRRSSREDTSCIVNVKRSEVRLAKQGLYLLGRAPMVALFGKDGGPIDPGRQENDSGFQIALMHCLFHDFNCSSV